MHGRRRIAAVSTAVLLAMALVATSCGRDGGGDGEASGPTTTAEAGPAVLGGKVVYGVIAESNGWDPSTSNWGPWSLLIANAMFDTLTRWDSEGNIQPYLASNFYPSDDYTQWRIETRENVTFHNGEPFNAEALEQNIEFHRNSPLTGQIFSRLTNVEVIDDRNVRITTSEPIGNLPAIFSTQIGVMMAPEMIANPDRARQPIGTGPFRMEEWTPDARMVLVKNDDYWQYDAAGNRLPYLDEVEFRPITDDGTRVDSLLSGDIDMAQISNPADLAELSENPDLQVFSDRRSEEDENFVMLNAKQPPFDQLLARQALAYGTDREAYNEAQNEGAAQLAESPYRPESVWYHDVDYPDFDPDRARELVAEYEEQFGPFEFTLTTAPSPRSIQGSQLLQQQWKDLGIDVDIASTEIASQIAQVVVGDYQATTWAQFSSPHPALEEVWWECYYVTDPPEVALNFARNCDEEMSDNIAKGRQDPDQENAKAYFDDVQQRMAESLPYIWLYHGETGTVTRPEVTNVLTFDLPNGKQGLSFNNGSHPLHQIWLED